MRRQINEIKVINRKMTFVLKFNLVELLRKTWVAERAVLLSRWRAEVWWCPGLLFDCILPYQSL